jgi:hypothetical protein
MADFNINPESFRFNQEEQIESDEIEDSLWLTEEDMQEVEIFNCSLCHDKFNTHVYRICEEHQIQLLKQLN